MNQISCVFRLRVTLDVNASLFFPPQRPTLFTASSLHVFDQIKTIENHAGHHAGHHTGVFSLLTIDETNPFLLCSQKKALLISIAGCLKITVATFKNQHSMGKE